MKRWRNGGFTRRRGLASAFSLLVLAIAARRPSGGSAQSASPASASLSRERLDGRRYLKSETIAHMATDHIGPETGIIHDPFYFPGETSGFGLGFAVRTAVPANTKWAIDEYRWDGAAGTSFFVDPRDDMFTIFMVQAPSQGGRLQMALKTLIYDAFERKN